MKSLNQYLIIIRLAYSPHLSLITLVVGILLVISSCPLAYSHWDLPTVDVRIKKLTKFRDILSKKSKKIPGDTPEENTTRIHYNEIVEKSTDYLDQLKSIRTIIDGVSSHKSELVEGKELFSQFMEKGKFTNFPPYFEIYLAVSKFQGEISKNESSTLRTAVLDSLQRSSEDDLEYLLLEIDQFLETKKHLKLVGFETDIAVFPIYTKEEWGIRWTDDETPRRVRTKEKTGVREVKDECNDNRTVLKIDSDIKRIEKLRSQLIQAREESRDDVATSNELTRHINNLSLSITELQKAKDHAGFFLEEQPRMEKIYDDPSWAEKRDPTKLDQK